MTPSEESWLALRMVRQVGNRTLSALVETFGSAEAVLEQSAESLMHRGGISQALADRILSARENQALTREIQAVRDAGAGVLTLAHPQYPPCLREIPQAAPLIYYQGKWPGAGGPRLAIVGTRSPSRYGEKVVRQVVEALAVRHPDAVVISGLARGIDTAAHTAALETGLETIAVLGSGLGRIYPAENQALAGRIAGQGVLFSEFFMHQAPSGRNFPIRNRMISGLTGVLLVVEAGGRSGALITASFALNHQKPVLAVPGNIDQPGSEGTNRLIQSGQAHIVTGPRDVLHALELLENPQAEQLDMLQPRVERPSPKAALEGAQGAVMQCLGTGPLHPDDISVQAGIPMEKLIALLLELELSGEIVQTTENQYALA